MGDQQSAETCFEAIRARGNQGIALLIGAGCSFTAGIPLAAGFVKLICARYRNRCGSLPPENENRYEYATDLLSDGEWLRLFGEIEAKARVNIAHLCIAELVGCGVVDRVLTTNFDSLLLQTCAIGKRFPRVHDCSIDDELDDWIDEEGAAIFYLHGQGHGRRMLNPGKLRKQREEAAAASAAVETGRGVKGRQSSDSSRRTDSGSAPAGPRDPLADRITKRADLVSKIVMGTIRRRPLIVCGYSGLHDTVFASLQGADDLNNPVFWVPYSDTDYTTARGQFGASKLQNRVFVIPADGKRGADEFFYELLLALGKDPPTMLKRRSSKTTFAAKKIAWPEGVDWDAWSAARVDSALGLGQEPAAPSDDPLAQLTMQKETTPWEEFSL